MRTLAQFHHTAWTRADGSPAAVRVIRQTSDGWLWLGTSVGLYRFDGVAFERIPEIEGSVLELFAPPEGGLWIATSNGSVSFLKDGRFVHHGEAQGMKRGATGLDRDRRGRMWAINPLGAFRLEDGRWQQVDLGPGIKMHASANALKVDREGTVWIRTSDAIVALLEGASAFKRVADTLPSDAALDIISSPDGAVWMSGMESGLHRLTAHASTVLSFPRATPENYGPHRFDRSGRLWRVVPANEIKVWAASSLAGFAGGALPAEHDTFGRPQGLSGAGVFSFFQDRENNVWIGTPGGLDRFRPNKLQRMPHQMSLAAVAPAQGGGIWSSGFGDLSLGRFDAGGLRPFPEALHHVVCAYRDPHGIVWLAGVGGLMKITGERLDKIPLPEGWGPDEFTHAMVMDRSGTLWVAMRGIRQWDGASWKQWELPPELRERNLRVMARDAEGRLWFGYHDNHIAVIDGDKVTLLSEKEGLQVGDVKALHAYGGRVWAGGSRGVALYEQGRFRAVTDGKGEPIRAVTGIVETERGELWINGADGITFLPKTERDRLVADPSYVPRHERFDAQDGLEGVAPQRLPLPTAIEGSDGKLWFTSTVGLYWIDPARIERNPLPPPVLVRTVHADGRAVEAAEGMALAEGTRSLTIDYTALSFSNPQRVRFRYKLDGVDDGWQDVGTRRQAFYTSLGPGTYRFNVTAANDDGVWNDTGAALAFTIRPTFFQTAWFRGAAVLLALAALYGVYRWRLHLTQARLQGHLQERLAERERIARELHDTLLQSLIGLMLRFDAATRRLAPGDANRAQFEAALAQADAVLSEGRDRVQGLRTVLVTADLARELEAVGTGLTEDHAAKFGMQVHGEPRTLHPAVLDEVFWIAREALLNAFRHAQAGEVRLELAYADDGLQMSVRDDGRGIDAAVVQAGHRAGHWGLPGMEERARKIGARLQILSDAGRGTRIEVQVPAALAYRDSLTIASRLRRWRKRGRRFVEALRRGRGA